MMKPPMPALSPLCTRTRVERLTVLDAGSGLGLGEGLMPGEGLGLGDGLMPR